MQVTPLTGSAVFLGMSLRSGNSRAINFLYRLTKVSISTLQS